MLISTMMRQPTLRPTMTPTIMMPTISLSSKALVLTSPITLLRALVFLSA